MRFAAPEYLALLWVVLALAAIRLAARWVRARRVRAFAAPELYAGLAPELGPFRRGLRDALRLLALAALVLALARPQFGQRLAVLKREGIDLVVAVDTSASMLAEDLKPNRLAVAKRAVVGLAERLRGDRLGIVVFSGSAFIQCPLTLDAKAARLLIDAIGPETVPDPGTALETAIDRADQAFASEEKRFKALVLFTDGEETAGDPLAAARRAAEKGVRIFTVGLGAERGEPIPLRNSAEQVVGYKKDKSGEVVLSRLDEATLRKVAEIGSGRYFRATPAMTELDELYAEIDRMEKREIEGGFSAHYEDRFHWFAVAAFVLLAAARLLGERRARAGAPARALAVALPPVVVLALGLSPSPAWAGGVAADLVHDGNRALSRGDAEAAAQRYLEALAKEPENPVIQYNLGNALYTGQQFPDADAAYGAAAGRADSALTGALSYNLGNSLFRQGRYGEAADAYKRVLRRNAADEDARWNLELALRKQSEEEEKKKQDNKQDNQQDNQQDNKQDNQQENQQQDKQQQKDQQQDQQNQEQQNQQNQGQQNQEQPQQGDSPESTGEEQMTAAAAARLLEALGNDEQQLLRERFRARGRRVDVEKDW